MYKPVWISNYNGSSEQVKTIAKEQASSWH